MAFEYSSFFSYRRNQGQRLFMRNLRDIIQTEGSNATNIPSVFFDEDSIHWGQEFR
jgi:hypothetical protein